MLPALVPQFERGMNSNEDLDALASRIEAEPSVWVRLALTRPSAMWEIRAFEVTLGLAPPSWRRHLWSYPNALLISSIRRSETVARWVRTRRVAVRGATVRAESLSSPAQFDRRQSRWTGIYEALDWPVDEWRAPFTEQLNAFQSELISDRAPSFSRFDLAVANLLALNRRPNWTLPSPELVVRRQDTAGRIARAWVGRSAVKVTIDGDGIAGAHLELAGDVPGQGLRVQRSGSQTIRFATPAGLPAGSWLVLHKNGNWLDRRNLPYPPSLQWQEPGVEYEVDPPGPSDNSMFSNDEQHEIREALAAVKLQLLARVLEHEPSEIRVLEHTLDDVSDALTRLGRSDWRTYVYGAFLTVIVEGLVPPDTVRTVAVMLGHAVAQLFGMQLPALSS